MSSGVLQKEQERKINDLNRQNFDLKMQIYYLNQKISEFQNQLNSSAVLYGNDPMVSLRGGSTVAETSHYIEENMTLRRKLEEMEKVIVQLKLDNDRLHATIIHSSTGQGNDRDAALLVAETDTLVMNKLEQEISQLKKEHVRDAKIADDYLEKISIQSQTIHELNSRLNQERGTTVRLQQKISLLLDRIKRLEIIMQRNNISYSREENFIGLDSMTDTLIDLNEQVSSHTPFDQGSKLNTTVISVMHPATGSKRHATPKDFLDFGSRTAWGELQLLRKQVNDLKQQLRSERELLKSQDDALRLLQQSISVVGKMESEEIKRLEKELDKSVEMGEFWKNKCINSDAKGTDTAKTTFDDNIDEWDSRKGTSSGALRLSAAVITGNKTISYTEHNKIVEMFKVREVELLHALEGVLLKCQQLEAKFN